MSQKHVLKFSNISNYFKEELKLLERGENAVESGDVVNMGYDDELKLIKGDVHASMRNKLYKVEIHLNEEGGIHFTTCTCPRGQLNCHHVAALAIFAHHNIAVTDQACRWSAPAKSKSECVASLDVLFPPSKSFQACGREVTDNDVKELYTSLQHLGVVVGFTWLLQPNVSPSDNLLSDVSEIVFSEEYLSNNNKKELFENKMRVSQEQIIQVASETVGQAENPKWLLARKFRLTASNFGLVLKACNRKRYPPSLFKTLMGSYTLDGIKSIQWGREHEKLAIEEFCTIKGLEVTPTGLWLDTCGYLGASPDGLISNNAIVEIKCPFKYRNSDLIESLKAERDYILHYSTETTFTINKKNNIYDQIQGQLYLTNRDLCYLFIWTPKTSIIQEVQKDEAWAVNLLILRNFYLNEFLTTFGK